MWRTDGTDLGTENIKIFTNGVSAIDWELKIPWSQDGFILFAASDGNGSELWRTDGTTDGTFMVYDVNPGVGGSNPERLFPFKGKYLFRADDGIHGRELWITDGTESGTALIYDINPGEDNSDPYDFITTLDQVIFLANDGIHGSELWGTDGSPSGTHFVKDLEPGIDGVDLINLQSIDRYLFFPAYIDDMDLWRSDGSSAGTLVVDETAPAVASSAGYAHKLYYSRKDDKHGAELWSNNGMPGGSKLVADINPGLLGSNIDNFHVWHGHLFFSADDGQHGEELWMVYDPEQNSSGAGDWSIYD